VPETQSCQGFQRFFLLNPNKSNSWKVIGAGDVDGDGKDDVIWRRGATDTVVWRMNGNQIIMGEYFTDGAGNQVNVPSTWKLEQVADWNGDGKADLFWRNISIDPVTNQSSNEIAIWLMNGNKIQSCFSLGAVRPGQGFEISAIGDVDGNGTTDILWRHSDGRVRLWGMNREGKLASDQLMTDVMSTNWQTVGMNDVTGDGKADILWRSSTTGQFLLWEMNGLVVKSRAEIQSADFTLTRSAVAMTQQRLNPSPEVRLLQGSVLWRDASNGHEIGLWNFGSTTQGPQWVSTEKLWQGAVTPDWKVEGIGDTNGDGISDVLWRNTVSNQVVVWELNGLGGLNLMNGAALSNVDSSWQVKGLCDVDGDRRSDVIWQHSVTNQLVVWQMDGRQQLGRQFVMDETGAGLVASAAQILEQVVDWDGDGKGDFFWRNASTGVLSVWLMDGHRRRSSLSLSDGLLNADWKLEGIGDSNGDGRGEVLWRNAVTGDVRLWERGAGNAIVQKSLGIMTSGWKSLGFADYPC
jgi:FG-GAP-like repeat